jgi:hypothetical protein
MATTGILFDPLSPTRTCVYFGEYHLYCQLLFFFILFNYHPTVYAIGFINSIILFRLLNKTVLSLN